MTIASSQHASIKKRIKTRLMVSCRASGIYYEPITRLLQPQGRVVQLPAMKKEIVLGCVNCDLWHHAVDTTYGGSPFLTNGVSYHGDDVRIQRKLSECCTKATAGMQRHICDANAPPPSAVQLPQATTNGATYRESLIPDDLQGISVVRLSC